MLSHYVSAPLIFLIQTVFGLYVFALTLRMLFQWCGADHRNPLSQFLIKVTHPPLKWMRRVIPSIGHLDTSALVLALLLETASGLLVAYLEGEFPALGVYFVIAVGKMTELVLDIYFYAIVFRALLSWFNPGTYNPAVMLLFSLTEPLLAFGRRLLPPTSGIDLSPIIPLVAIHLARMLLLPPIFDLAMLLR